MADARRVPTLPASALALLLAAAWMLAAAEPEPQSAHRPDQDNVRVTILYPCDESTVFDEDGAIEVEIAVSPSVALVHGNRVELRLDGRAVRRRKGEDFVLPELESGPHYLRARLLDAAGNVLLHADPVRFYFWPAKPPAALR